MLQRSLCGSNPVTRINPGNGPLVETGRSEANRAWSCHRLVCGPVGCHRCLHNLVDSGRRICKGLARHSSLSLCEIAQWTPGTAHQQPVSQEIPGLPSVSVGSFSDRDQFDGGLKGFDGLAHLTEHLLFAGTANHRGGDRMEAFIQSKDGQSNAYTANDSTTFFFSLSNKFDNDHFPALDRLSDAMKNAEFDPQTIDDELEIIEQEYQKRINTPIIRVLEVAKSLLGHPEHPIRIFGTGNKSYFDKIDRRAMIRVIKAFHQRYYKADQMTLAIEARYGLGELESQVRKHFSSVQSGGVRPLSFEMPSAPQSTRKGWQQYYKIHTNSTDRFLACVFPILDPMDPKALEWKPDQLLTYILNEPSEGGLVSQLRKTGLVKSAHASLLDSERQRGYGLYIIMVNLREARAAEPETAQTVLQIIRSHLNKLVDKPLPPFVYEDFVVSKRGRFHVEKDSNQGSLEELSEHLSRLPGHPKQLLQDVSLPSRTATVAEMQEFVMQFMRLGKALIGVYADFGEDAKGFTQEEKHYSSKFEAMQMQIPVEDSPQNLQPWTIGQAIDYLPKDKAIRKGGSLTDQRPVEFSLDADRVILYHRLSAYPSESQVMADILVVRKENTDEYIRCVANAILAELMEDALFSLRQRTAFTGAGISVACADNHLQLHLSGTPDQVLQNATNAARLISHFKPDDGVVRDAIAAAWSTIRETLQEARTATLATTEGRTRSSYCIPEDMMKRMKDFMDSQYQSTLIIIVKSMVEALKKNVSIEALVVGNATQQEAQSLITSFASHFQLATNRVPRNGAIGVFPLKGTMTLSSTLLYGRNSGVMVSFAPLSLGAGSGWDPHLKAKLRLLVRLLNLILGQSFSDYMRNSVKVSYNAYTRYIEFRTLSLFYLYAESSKVNPDELHKTITKYLKDYYKSELPKLTQDRFKELLEVQCQSTSEPYPDLAAEFADHSVRFVDWNRPEEFGWWTKLADPQVRDSITLDSFTRLFKEQIAGLGQAHRSLVVQAWPPQHQPKVEPHADVH